MRPRISGFMGSLFGRNCRLVCLSLPEMNHLTFGCLYKCVGLSAMLLGNAELLLFFLLQLNGIFRLISCRELYSTFFCYAMMLVKLVCFIPTMSLYGVVVEQHQVNLWQ
jgi:hypothetical protein